MMSSGVIGDRQLNFPYNASSSLMSILILDPFGGAKPRLLRRGKGAPLRVNPEQAQALRPGSRRFDLMDKVNSELPNLHSVFCCFNDLISLCG
jgi:hypothetical protein